MRIVYSGRERLWLSALALFTFFGINGAFVYGLLHRDVLQAALANPLALAFILEALLLVGVLAYLLRKWDVAEFPGAGSWCCRCSAAWRSRCRWRCSGRSAGRT